MTSTIPEDESKRIAILVLDFQNEFITPGGKLHTSVKHMIEKTGIVANLSKFVHIAR